MLALDVVSFISVMAITTVNVFRIAGVNLFLSQLVLQSVFLVPKIRKTSGRLKRFLGSAEVRNYSKLKSQHHCLLFVPFQRLSCNLLRDAPLSGALGHDGFKLEALFAIVAMMTKVFHF